VSTKVTDIVDRGKEKIPPKVLWMLNYINFKMAFLTTCYGALGLIVVFNLAVVTDQLTVDVTGWTNDTLGPALNQIQLNIQNGIDNSLLDISNQMNSSLQDARNAILLGQVQTTISQIQTSAENVLNQVNHELDNIANDFPFFGGPVNDSLHCFLPLSTIQFLVSDALSQITGFLDILNTLQVRLPRFTFHKLASIGTQATRIAVVAMMNSVQDRILRYKVVFIVLTVAIGILIFQGLAIMLLEKVFKKGKRQLHNLLTRRSVYQTPPPVQEHVPLT